MKRFYVLLLALLFVLSGCGMGEALPTEPVSQPHSGPGDLMPLCSVTEAGYYSLIHFAGPERELLQYTDFASCSTVPLCAVPGCTHSDGQCISCLPEDEVLEQWTVLQDGRLLFNTGNIRGAYSQRLYLCNGDGGQCRLLAQLKEGEALSWLICSDTQYIYGLTGSSSPDDLQVFLTRWSLTDGTAEKLMPCPFMGGGNIRNVDGRNLVLLTTAPDPAEDLDIQRMLLLNVDTGEQITLSEWLIRDYRTDAPVFCWDDGMLYWCNGSLPGEISIIHRDGSWETLVPQWPEEILAAGQVHIRLEMVLRDRLLITVWGPWDDGYTSHRFVVSLADGSMTYLPLEYLRENFIVPITILGQSGDSLLVEFSTRYVQGIHIDPDGLLHNDSYSESVVGLIGIDDFLASNPVYREMQ